MHAHDSADAVSQPSVVYHPARMGCTQLAGTVTPCEWTLKYDVLHANVQADILRVLLDVNVLWFYTMSGNVTVTGPFASRFLFVLRTV